MREGELREPKGEGSLHAVFSPKYVHWIVLLHIIQFLLS